MSFTLNNVRWSYRESREVNPPLGVETRSRTGLKSATIRCNDCGEQWNASNAGHGKFVSGLGAITVTCPSCDDYETIRTAQIT